MPALIWTTSGVRCQEASMFSGGFYVTRDLPAVAIVRHDKDSRSYYVRDVRRPQRPQSRRAHQA
jgi:hypothetical protein